MCRKGELSLNEKESSIRLARSRKNSIRKIHEAKDRRVNAEYYKPKT